MKMHNVHKWYVVLYYYTSNDLINGLEFTQVLTIVSGMLYIDKPNSSTKFNDVEM